MGIQRITSIVFSQNRDRLQEELTEFCKHKFKEDLSDVVRFNLDMCRDYTNIYPIQKTYKQDTLQNTLGLLDSETITLDHYDKEELEPLEFYHRVHITIREKIDIGDVHINHNMAILKNSSKLLEIPVGDEYDSDINFNNPTFNKLIKHINKDSWYYNNKKIYYKHNEYGYRSDNLSDINDNDYILTFGCSYSYGVGLFYEDTYSYKLANELNLKNINLADRRFWYIGTIL